MFSNNNYNYHYIYTIYTITINYHHHHYNIMQLRPGQQGHQDCGGRGNSG